MRRAHVWLILTIGATITVAWTMRPSVTLSTPPMQPASARPSVDDPRCASPERAASPTALTALHASVSHLAALHPNGRVLSMYGQSEGMVMSELGTTPIRRWSVWVWAPDRGRRFGYDLTDQGLAPSGMSDAAQANFPSIADLSLQQVAASIQDSDQIVARTDELGARGYCERTGSPLVFMELRGKNEAGPLVWRITYKYGQVGSGLEMVVDATSGDLLSFQNKDRLFQAVSPEARSQSSHSENSQHKIRSMARSQRQVGKSRSL